MFKITNQIEAGVFINGQELQLTGGNFMQSLHIRSSARGKLPVCALRFTDLYNSAVNIGLQDNVPLVVVLNGVINREFRFRVHRWMRTPAGDAFNYLLEGYWDSPKYWAATTNASIQGSSYEAIRQIASKCDIGFSKDNTPTSDTMIWNPGNRVYGEFAKIIARHGFVNEKSHMVLGVDLRGEVRYRDINANKPPSLNFGHVAGSTSGTFVQILDFTPTATAGDNNTIAGYLHDRYTQPLEKAEVLKEVTLDPDSKKPLVNMEVRDMIGRGGISYGPIDFGNTHIKYERALYQNTRFNLLNSLQAEVTVGFETDLDLFDNFKYVPPPQMASDSYAGEYTINDKIIYIPGNSYYEKFLVTKNGLEV